MKMKKLTEQDPETKSPDLIAENIEQLKAFFPEAFTEDKIDFEVLKQLLGSTVDEREEKYGLNWHGKRRARQIALTPSTGTLRPCPEDSVDWDTTQNLMIEGDNLEVLKLLQKSYAGKVKLIYIDPPYNTGNEFVYSDDFQDNIKNYLMLTGQIDSDGRNISTNTEASGRFHTDWINMMYPRLKLAKNLLRDDGVMFLSIGEEELSNSEKILNEIFGEENKISIITRVAKTASNLGTHFAPSVDFLLCYSKNAQLLPPFKDKVDESLYKKSELTGPRKGEKYRDDVAFYQASQNDLRPNQKYFVECPDGSKVIPPCTILDEVMREGDGRWRWSKNTYLQNKDLIVFKETKRSPLLNEHRKQAKYNLYTKSYLNDRTEDGTLPRNLLNDFINRKGADLIKKYGIKFDFSKPIELMKYLAEIVGTAHDDVILDFFSGSCSTAHSIIDLNKEDGANRKYIMVQFPEVCDETSEAYKAGFKTIAEIGKERIRRVISRIKEENPEYQGDLGFRVFKLNSSNIRAWEPDRDNLAATLEQHAEHLKTDRTEDDILYELLLKLGLELTVPIEQKKITGKIVHSIGAGTLLVCLATKITTAEVEPLALGIVKWHKELAPAGETQVVFRDSAFSDDVAKTNITAILQQYGLANVRSL
jgi:adenine-specific DNA-methyltransferase